jgi:hypothetical protein
LGAVQVQLTGLDREPVPGRFSTEPLARRAQRRSQARDVALQAVARAGRRLLTPEGVDQPLLGDRGAVGQQQQRQHRPRPHPAEREYLAVAADLDRAEQAELDAGHRFPSPARPLTVTCARPARGRLDATRT